MGIGITEILILAALLALLFGSRKLPALGADLAKGIRGFRAQLSGTPAPGPAVADAPFEDQPAVPRKR